MSQHNPYQPPAPSVDQALSPGATSLVQAVAPCPKCQAQAAAKVSFTWWGGALGPRLFSVVKCSHCGTQYKGKTGAKLTTTIVAYQLVAVGLMIAIWLALRS